MAEFEQIIDDCGEPLGFLAKGHITKEEMEKEIHRWGWDDVELRDSDVKHTVMRKVPVHPHHEFGDVWSFQYVEAKPGPGAFECTVVYLY